MNTEFKNRLKSFAWRLGGMIAAMSLSFLLDNLGILGLSLNVQVVLGLIIGELTKWLNNRYAQ